MKTTKQILVAVLISFFAFNCKNDMKPQVKTVGVETETTKIIDPNATYAKAEFTIDGMTCAIGCAATIEKKLAKMDGVKSAKVDFDKKLAMVEYNEAKVSPILIEKTVTNVSDIYTVSNMKLLNGFSTKKLCDENCKKPCCADKTEVEKMACAADCKKACCVKKA